MRGREYIRSIYRQLQMQEHHNETHGAFLMAALDVMAELESPLKEETLVRLVVLELEQTGSPGRRMRACA